MLTPSEACDNIVQAPLPLPEILAPAGNMASALAAFAAGADAIYLGLKHFSARMLAENFSVTDLARLTSMAQSEGKRVYVALNTLLKPSDTDAALRLIKRLTLDARPDALIVQDIGVLELARLAGFQGELHLSTLANIAHQKALVAARAAGANRVIIPRELTIDEVRTLGETCPEGLELELFVHGALCYCVSGRCWWSSYMGGKSGLRGRCVQPCRRKYTQKGREGRFFSCLDLSLDVLTRQLLTIPNLCSWKIEGRKKTPHYVYHVVSAYRLLRDEPDSPESRKEAEHLIAMALGRPTTTSLFLPQKHASATATSKDTQTSSGMICGKTERSEEGRYILRPRLPLFTKDLLRIGYEDEPWHATIPVTKNVNEGDVLQLHIAHRNAPKNGTPVFLIDRKEPELQRLMSSWDKLLKKQNITLKSNEESVTELTAPNYGKKQTKEKFRSLNVIVRSSLPQGRSAKTGITPGSVQGLWLSPRTVTGISQTLFGRISWWLPPVIWPNEEDAWAKIIQQSIRKGARHFVCNEPWQTAFFESPHKLALTAGPFCNIANGPALAVLQKMGFSAAIISPELGERGILSLPKQSLLPLGIVVAGYWPMGITRHGIGPLKTQETFSSPKKEEFWSRRYGQSTWLYPAWPLDLHEHVPALERAGYTTFITLEEHPPKSVAQPKRTSDFNWKLDVL